MMSLILGIAKTFAVVLTIFGGVAAIAILGVLVWIAVKQLWSNPGAITSWPWKDVATFLAILVGIVAASTGLTHALGFVFIKTGLVRLAATLDTIWWVVTLVVFSMLAASFRFGTTWMKPTWTWLTGTLKAGSTTQPMKGVGIGLILTAVYFGLLYFGYHTLAAWIVGSSSASYRGAWLIVTILGLPTIASFFILYKATGLPETSEDVRKGMKVLYLSSLAFFAWWYYDSPNQFFDTKEANKSLFWVDEGSETIYYHGGYSPVTGKELRPGTPEDAKKFQQESLAKKLPSVISSAIGELKSVSLKVEAEKNAGTITVVAPASGDWSEVINLPSSQLLSIIYAPRTSSVEMRIVGSGKIYTFTADPNVKDQPAEDLKGRGIQFRKKGGVIVDVIWRKI